MDNIVLHWRIPEKGRYGDGISRPREGDRTRWYTLRVALPGCLPMKVTLAAPSRRAALRYASNRWPDGVAEVAA